MTLLGDVYSIANLEDGNDLTILNQAPMHFNPSKQKSYTRKERTYSHCRLVIRCASKMGGRYLLVVPQGFLWPLVVVPVQGRLAVVHVRWPSPPLKVRVHLKRSWYPLGREKIGKFVNYRDLISSSYAGNSMVISCKYVNKVFFFFCCKLMMEELGWFTPTGPSLIMARLPRASNSNI